MSFFSLKKRAPGTRSKSFWTIWTVLLALTACAASKMDYALIDQGVTSGKRSPLRSPSRSIEVIGDRASYDRLVTEIYSDRLPPSAPPEIDFQEWWVVFISLGEKPSAGYRLRVKEVTRAKETVRVKIEEEIPSPNHLQATLMTEPFALVKIKKEPAVKKVALVDTDNKVIEERPFPVEKPGPND